MSFANQLKSIFLKYNLLNHPFYQLWNDGKISLSTLQDYSMQYLFQVEYFPTYISKTHSITEDFETRKILTENLADEELGKRDHISLWKDFVIGLSVNEVNLKSRKMCNSIKNLVDTCKFYSGKSTASGIGVLYAQEHNYANIATTKRNGLQNHYGFKKHSAALEFFNVHEKADIWHAEQVEKILERLCEEGKIEAENAGVAVMKALNEFLDEMLSLEGTLAAC